MENAWKSLSKRGMGDVAKSQGTFWPMRLQLNRINGIGTGRRESLGLIYEVFNLDNLRLNAKLIC